MIRRNLSRFGVTFLVAANWLSFAHAQSSTPQQDPPQSATQTTAEALKKLDQLVEQNRQLEKQNRSSCTRSKFCVGASPMKLLTHQEQSKEPEQGKHESSGESIGVQQ
jgi:hypothetical protein